MSTPGRKSRSKPEALDASIPPVPGWTYEQAISIGQNLRRYTIGPEEHGMMYEMLVGEPLHVDLHREQG